MPTYFHHKFTTFHSSSPIDFMIRIALTVFGMCLIIQTTAINNTYAQTSPCTLERGTVNDDNTFTTGNDSTDVDLRIRCTGDLSSMQEPYQVHGAYLEDITGLNTQQIGELLNVLSAEESLLQIDLSAAHSEHTAIRLRIAPNVIPELYKVVVVGTQTLPTTPVSPSDAVSLLTNTANPYFLRFDNYSTIVNERTANGRGMQIATSGGIEVRNFSHITTKGSSSFGVYLRASKGSEGIFAANEQGPTIRTEGIGYPIGIYAQHDGTGSIRIENRGNIITTGSEIARGIQIQANEGGSSEIVNEGSVETAGTRAHGLVAYTQTNAKTNSVVPGATARVHNKSVGTITTSGNGSFGIRVEHNTTDDPTTTDENWIAEAINDGTITLSGDAIDQDNAGNRIYGMIAFALGITNNARVVNTGTLNATGHKSIGLGAFTQGNGLADIQLTGGTVTAGAIGNFGTGILGVSQTEMVLDESNSDIDVDILVSGQSTQITAYGGSDDSRTAIDESKAIGIQAFAGGKKMDDSPSTGHSRIRILNSATVNAQGGYAVQFATGRGTLEIETGEPETNTFNSQAQLAGTQVTGDINFAIGDYTDSFTLTRSQISGDVNFEGGDDTMTLSNWGTISGDINFGDGNDTFVMNVAGSVGQVDGRIQNAETLRKKGAGVMRLNQVSTNSPSSMHIEQGNLVITGGVNLGEGTATVHDGSRLTFEIGDIVADQLDHGSLSAESLLFEGDYAEVYAQFNNDLSDEKLTEIRENLAQPQNAPRINLLRVDKIMHNNREITSNLSIHSENEESTVQEVGKFDLTNGIAKFQASKVDQIGRTPTTDLDLSQIKRIPTTTVRKISPTPKRPDSQDNPPEQEVENLSKDEIEEPPQDRIEKNKRNSGPKIGLGLMAILLAMAAAENESQAEPEVSLSRSQRTSVSGVLDNAMRLDEATPSHGLWARSYRSNDPAQYPHATVRSDMLGWTVQQQNGYFFSGSLAPNVATNSDFDGASAKGNLYNLSSGYRSDQFFFNFGTSYGEFNSASGFASHITGSYLTGKPAFTTSQIAISAGGNVAVARLNFEPKLSFLKGSYQQQAHIADNDVLEARIPSFRQDYSTQKLDLNFRSSNWLNLSNSLRMKLFANISAVRTQSTTESQLNINVADKLGVLSFSEPAHIGSLPQSVNTFQIGANIQPFGHSNQRIWLNYFNLEVDGSHEHALVLGGEIRF